MLPPTYPKPNPEYRQRVLNDFYKKIKNTNWNCNDDNNGKPRGRGHKDKCNVRIESKARTEGERKAQQQGYNWFEKWEK